MTQWCGHTDSPGAIYEDTPERKLVAQCEDQETANGIIVLHNRLEATVLMVAECLYTRRRRYVSGRPMWDRLDINDLYDQGMRNAAIQEAREVMLG